MTSLPCNPMILQIVAMLSTTCSHQLGRPPGISDGAFQLRMDNIWFCKLLLLFKIHTKTDTGMQYHECAYVSVLEEYKGPRKSGHIMHILHIVHILICLSTSAWVDQCQSAIVYERHEQAQVFYVIPVKPPPRTSFLNTQTPSSCSSGGDRDNSLRHATRIG